MLVFKLLTKNWNWHCTSQKHFVGIGKAQKDYKVLKEILQKMLKTKEEVT